MFAQLRSGETYYAGFDKPVLASWGDVRDGLAENGLELAAHFERDKPPLPFRPQSGDFYSDDWDQVAIVRVRQPSEVELPDRVKWLWRVQSPNLARAAPAPVPVTPEAIAGRESGEAASRAAAEASARARARAEARGSSVALPVGIALGLYLIARGLS